LASLDPDTIDSLLDGLAIDTSVSTVTPFFKGGPTQAKQHLRRFIDHDLATYRQGRSHPRIGSGSGMSPYLHFGHISPVFIALKIAEAPGISPDDRDAYLEELIIRRELAVNFVTYTPDYDGFSCLPAWARKTLSEHANDPRTALYDERTLIAGRTHDPYWNAAMAEMRHTGFMHNTMRMYWGKKILEWSASPKDAYTTTLEINNRFFLDGRDPNSFAGVGWIYGLHDRAWFEREIFGKVRYMAASGLERKYDMQTYIDQVAALNTRAAS
jgi:deoxyribodipyrimidine photo-lyase